MPKKNPLSARERNGLIAVAAASLLTIGGAFWLRTHPATIRQTTQTPPTYPTPVHSEQTDSGGKEQRDRVREENTSNGEKQTEDKKATEKGQGKVRKPQKEKKKQNRKKQSRPTPPTRDPFESIPSK